jgi:predicted TIM-barrel fold metal-dependent hydrolase
MINQGFEIMDFHTHPFSEKLYNICNYYDVYDTAEEDIKKTLQPLGITKIAGSAIQYREPIDSFAKVRACNDCALAIAERMGGFYIPGFHVHPHYVEDSVEEVGRMARAGVKLIGELVPYLQGWRAYNEAGLFPILEEAAKHSMVVSFHDMAVDTIDEMVSRFPDITFVNAHPGEKDSVLRHIERMKKYDNLYLDISGTGIFRWNMLRYLVDTVGSERILFGTDYPICNPGVYIGGVLAEPISDEAKENIFSKNAKRILSL